MAGEFTYEAAKHTYFNGNRYQGLHVINFTGPSGKRLSAYSGVMNLDADGEPQAYAPYNTLNPRNPLGDAGWQNKGWNNQQVAIHKENVKKLAELDQALKDLKEQKDKEKKAAHAGQSATASTPKSQTATPTPPQPQGGAPNTANSQTSSAPPKSMEQLKAEIGALEQKIPYGTKHPRPKNFGKIFWDWYGLFAITPEDAANERFNEISSINPTVRTPNLPNKGVDKELYEDVNGKFPVIQSVYEPGPGYFVSQIPSEGFGAMNVFFKKWDQRYYLSPHKSTIGKYAAVSPAFTSDTGVDKKDTCVAIRLDNGMTSSFVFRDVGSGYRLGECSIGAFESMGGVLNQKNINASNNEFRILYLAFPNGARPEDVLADFAAATNADDFLNLLAFIVRATKRAPEPQQDKITKKWVAALVKENPTDEFETWKKSASKTPPEDLDVVKQAVFGVSGYGSGLWTRKYMDAHPSLMETGLVPPEKPWTDSPR
jgi:hypothetical protein